MKATNIAHLVGQMDTILDTIEYQAGYLMELVNEAKDVNEKIFEMHKKNELDRIKKNLKR